MTGKKGKGNRKEADHEEPIPGNPRFSNKTLKNERKRDDLQNPLPYSGHIPKKHNEE